MSPRIRGIASLAAATVAALLCACSEPERAPTEPYPMADAAGDVPELHVEIPTEEEAAAAAEEAITEANADEEFDKLYEEIMGDQ